MPTILQIETATQVCSVAIAVNGETIALKEQKASNIHASSLTCFIEDVMLQAGLKYQDLDAIAVSKGPGSYTGLRIGVATAKGLCFALDKPLIAINTLTLMANGYINAHPNFGGLICPMIDARRMEVYTAVYTNKLNFYEEVSAKIIDEKSFSLYLQNHFIAFIGDGAAKCQSVIDNVNAHFYDTDFNSAAHMSKLAEQAFEEKKFEDIAYFEPFYLKDFVATTPKKKV
ncbi:tRNA (adenosine(37)-N6)-threonylcarbamoyltransferase complex dimerization subunit type 1 TsaB [Pedobacter montanisoli]|uniref:tRNA (Adenosine(37)-N6)-threonylcarbamoyltransferase complex dimerization subunit type 1 TsaB n=1 Tax=Pedobacter montanisoli TaxID=2923277 RepID=A0ABS9ZZ60_9SPHI|nr:tRNA (adenosine(37)-N6)-threonylcarbamoyltransferase complex dimerization subunit type 1 TsaB [Pedobacter montanisoli]MCJ0743604.1 tRNA (adenosine(37)-N6)-threonylcarbamoyltransferase complex dimerization subunit type 1 TsaB [Pedobacter montanisoli]